jgi:hypothetical protein
MINLKQLSERYKDVGLGHISFGGKSYYEIDSDTPLRLNSYSGKDGFVLNELGEVELCDLNDNRFVKRRYFLDENWDYEVDYETEHFWDETKPNMRWGKTLDNYYPHPWFPDKEIVAFEVINNLPFNRKGTIEKVVGGLDGWIELESPDGAYDFTVVDCLQCPEFFKPIYNE